MSSYYPSFNYIAPNGVVYNSYKDKKLIVTHFESGDDGEMDTFLGMEPVYADNTYGTRRFDYGAKYVDVAVIRISVMKANGKDFTVAEVRDFLRWTTGSRKTSYLDLVDGEEVIVSFLGRITKVYQQKLDARTIGFVIEHTSVSPYAYSPIQYATCYFGEDLAIDVDGIVYKKNKDLIVDDGIVINDRELLFNITNDGVVCLGYSVNMKIDNDTDDLSDYIYMDVEFRNVSSDHLIIKNQTLYAKSRHEDGMTQINDIGNHEKITLSSGQFITSSNGRAFGNSFNFVWPKLLPGVNEFVISSNGDGMVNFSYRYPIKIGDCAMDLDVYGECLCDGDHSDNSNNNSGSTSGPVTWGSIIGKPSTIRGYGITDAYTITEVNEKLSDVGVYINEDDLNEMLDDVLE